MLDYKEFKEIIINEVKAIIGEETKVEFKTVHKINQVSYEGMMVSSRRRGVFPTIPMEPCFVAYQNGHVSLDQVIQMVRTRLLVQEHELSDFIRDVQTGNNIKERIFMRVINYEKNKVWLADYPHRRRLDLAITYYIGTDDRGTDMYVANITYKLMQEIGLTEEELYSLAYENSTTKQPSVIKKIKDTFPKILWDMASEMLGDDSAVSEADDLMYVLTNPKKKLGAVCMFYEGVFEELAERLQDDLFILPSSTHEVIIVPCEGLEAEKLQEIVKEVNRTSVEADEVLGESVYIYRRSEKMIEIVAHE